MLQEKYIFTVNILHFRTWRMSVSLSMEMLALQKAEMLQDTIILLGMEEKRITELCMLVLIERPFGHIYTRDAPQILE